MTQQPTPAYAMKPIPGAGFGMVATRPIPRGTLIISEAPLFTLKDNIRPADWTTEIESKLLALSNDQKQIFFSLHNSYPQEFPVANSIIKTNAIAIEAGGVACGVFPNISRFNHSCASNANYTYNHEVAEETVYAVKDIAVGDEITVFYLDKVSQNQPRTKRQRILMHQFSFECQCNTCGASPEDVAVSDHRRREINRWDAMIGGGISTTNPAQCLWCCKRILQLYKEEGICHLAVYTTYFDAFEACILHGDRARASAFASLAAEIKQTCQGENVAELRKVKCYVKNPEHYQGSERFRTWVTRTESARAVGTDGFEEWLWSRAESDSGPENSSGAENDSREENDYCHIS